MIVLILAIVLVVAAATAIAVAAASARVLREYERGVVFRLGRVTNQRGPGLIFLIPGVERIVNAELTDVPHSHLLDAAAFMWTARRISARAGMRVPLDPEWDGEGLRMEIMR